MSGYRIAFNFDDGVTHFVEAQEGEGMVEAAYRHGINIPIDCRDGVCGTCKARLIVGERKETDALGILDETEIAEGCFLPCQYRVTTDCIVEIPVDSALCSQKSTARIDATVSAVEKIGATVYRLRLAGAALGRFPFLPGQYARVAVPDTPVSRAYSFANVAGSDEVEFLIREIPGGVMSDFLVTRARPGRPVTIEGPFGSFYLRGQSKRIVFVAGGTGIAPILAMLRAIMRQPDVAGYSVTVLYGARDARDLVETAALEQCRGKDCEFTFRTIAEAGGGEGQPSGFVTGLLSPELFQGGDVDIYLCGPPPMVDSTLTWLRDNGCHPRAIYFERFSAAE